MKRLASVLFALALSSCTSPTPSAPGPSSTPPSTQISSPAPTKSEGPASQSTPSSGSKSISTLVAGSACAKHAFGDKGVFDNGSVEGLALSYHRTICRWKSPDTTVAGLIGGTLGQADKDALVYLGHPGTSGTDNIKEMYTIGFGLMARESEGKYCEGRDTSSKGYSDPATEDEAGPFQASYNSRSIDVDRMNGLWAWFKAHLDQCDLDVWKRGIDVNAKANWNCKTEIRGSGSPGTSWQAFTRQCPAFAAEWAMAVARKLRKHFGPIVRKEVDYYAPCKDLLTQVESLPCN